MDVNMQFLGATHNTPYITFALRGVDKQLLCMTIGHEDLARLIYHPDFGEKPVVRARHIQKWLQNLQQEEIEYHADFCPHSQWMYVIDLAEQRIAARISDDEFYTTYVSEVLYERLQLVLETPILDYIASRDKDASGDYELSKRHWQAVNCFSSLSKLRARLIEQGFKFSPQEEEQWFGRMT